MRYHFLRSQTLLKEREVRYGFALFAARWQTPYGGSTVGLTVLSQRGLFQQDWWRWVGIAVLLGFALVFNALVLLAQTFLNRELSLTIPVKSGLQLSTAYGPLACDDIASCSHSACDDILCLGCLASDDIISLGPVAWDNTISSVPMVRCEIFLRMADPAHASLATLKWTCTEDFICCSDWECGGCYS